jgi:large subunit ribosomal protein L5
MARLQEHYKKVVVQDLMKKFGYKSVMQVPRIQKIVLNMGVGEAVGDKKIMDNAVGDLTKIAGQKPIVTMARTSIATFKIRKGYPVGCTVTLRGTHTSSSTGSSGRDSPHTRLPRHIRPLLRRAR